MSITNALPLPKINRTLHIRFFQHFLHACPPTLSEFDSNRVTIAFFSLGGIDILNGLETLTPSIRQEIIDWIYHLQVFPLNDGSEVERICGFQGGSSSIYKNCDRRNGTGHLANTYTGLACLLTLGDDLAKVDRAAILAGVRALQQPDGSFCGVQDNEADMRFVYCAACVCYILDDFSAIDVERMVSFIVKSLSYDGAIGQGPGMESHGGSTFCAVAALVLSSSLHVLSSEQIERLKRWCVLRQEEGFNGRPNKPEDTCYSFWIVGTLALLGGDSWVNPEANRSFVMSTQDSRGGFSKWPRSGADPHHAYLGLAGLSLLGEDGLAPVEPSLCISLRAFNFLKELHQRW